MFRWPKRQAGSAKISADNPAAEDLRCSFCEKPKEDVLKLIAGPTVFICDECVQTCADIIAADEPPNALPESSQMIPREGEVSCSLCGRPASPDMMLWVENRGLLCGDCANAVEDALNRERPTS